MKRKRSITKSYFITLITISFLGLVILGSVSLYKQYSNLNSELKDIKEEYIDAQRNIVKFETERALEYIDWRKANANIPDGELQKEILEWFSKIRFENRGNESGILFVRSYEGILLMSVSTDELVGQDLSLMLDPDSINTHELFMETIKNSQGGYAQYSWYNPITKKIGSKISFVKGFPEWQWYIGAGFWIDDINSTIDQKRSELHHNFKNFILLIISTMLILLILIYINVWYISRKMGKSFSVLSSFFRLGLTNPVKIDLKNIEYAEFDRIGSLANEMIMAREETDKLLQQSQDRWQFALEGSGDGVWDWNVISNEVFYSKRWKEMLGYSEDEISNNFSEWDNLMHPDDKEKAHQEINMFLKGDSEFLYLEHRLLCKDGTYKIILSRGKIISWTNDKKPLRLIGTHYDLSTQKEAEKELMTAKEFSEKIIETSNAIIVGLDKDHLIRIFNKGVENITGYSKAEVIGKDWFKIFFPEEIFIEMNKVWKDAWGTSSHAYENSIVTKNKKERIISWQTTGIYEGEDNNKDMLISIGEDITEKKESEEALNTANKIINRSHAVAFLWKNEKGWPVEFVTENIASLTGYSAQEFMKRKIIFNEIIHKNDLKKVEKEVSRYSKDEGITSFTHEPYRIISKTGEIKWVNDTTYIQRNFKGKITHYEGIIIDITNRIISEEKTKRLSRIFEDSLNEIYLFDANSFIFTQVNMAAQQNLGYTMEELQKMTPLDIKPEFTLELFKELVEPLRAGLKPRIVFETVHQRKDKSLYNTQTHLQLMKFEQKEIFTAIILDVTERKNTENALLISKNKLESIFRAAPTGIGVVSNRIITEVNQKFCDMMGYKEKELLGKESIILYPSKEEFEWVGKEKYEQIKEKGTGTVETKLKHKDGHVMDVLLSSTPMDLNDLSIGVTFTALDISQRKNDIKELENHRNHLEELVKERTGSLEESQNALLNLVDDINLQSSKLEKSNTALAAINEELETFTYSVSHDLKAPLRGIDGYSQLLLDTYIEELNPEAQEFLRNIRKSTSQMNLLIEDLLAYSRMERQDFKSESLDLKVLIDNLLQYYSNIIKTKKIKVKTSFPEIFKPLTDKNGINLVLRNLIDNAIKFSSPNKKAQIEIGGSESNSKWLIFVKDNGIGFDMKYHDRIYNIFQRLQLAEEYEGTGIGLAMVSKAMSRMKGRVWAESTPNEGSCFYLEINKP